MEMPPHFPSPRCSCKVKDMQTQHDALTVTLDYRGRLLISAAERPLLAIHPRDWIVESVDRVTRRHWIAWEFFRERGRHRHQIVDVVPLGRARWSLIDRRMRRAATLEVRQESPSHIVLSLATTQGNRVGFVWWAPTDEHLYGFGEYGDGPRQRPGRWSTWSEEGPVGLGPLSPWLRWTGRVPIPRGYRATYAPSPTWLSSQGYGAWVDQSERIDWALNGARRSVRLWAPRLDLHLVTGPDVRTIIQRRSTILGAPSMPPIWQFSPWNDAVQGEHEALTLASRLREHGIPSSAIWIEDWTGSWQDHRRFWMRPLSHQLSRSLYPHWESMVDELHRDGFKVLGYFCPEVAVDTPLYQTAMAGGHLVVDAKGCPVDVDILGKHHGELDLTRLETRQWVKDAIFAPAAAMGFDGWMADFGEHLPVDSCLADGTTGWQSHNRYPELWQSLHREFWETSRPHGDWTFFVRSAALRTPTLAPAMWGGDSDTDWDRADGLPTVVPQALSAGVSGNVFWGTDIGGYMTFGLTPPRSKELFIRWAELAALLPLMRTHHGTARPRNWDWDRDDETLAAYAVAARLHALLFPLFYTLADEACRTGLPLVRPVWMEYATALDDNRQYLLGHDLLVAPVVKNGQRHQIVDFPPGRWHDWWTGTGWTGSQRATVDAPLGRPVAFWRDGAWLALSEGVPTADGVARGFVDTLALPEGARAVSQALTLAHRLGTTAGDVRVVLPEGVLEGVGHGPFKVSALPDAPLPRYVHHAPLLGEGWRIVLAPGIAREFGGTTWTWSGSDVLQLTLRPLKLSSAADAK